jgi:hypothetical protein
MRWQGSSATYMLLGAPSAIYEFRAALLQSMYWWCYSAIHVLLQASKSRKRRVGR